jgi:hypothetical protein
MYVRRTESTWLDRVDAAARGKQGFGDLIFRPGELNVEQDHFQRNR